MAVLELMFEIFGDSGYSIIRAFFSYCHESQCTSISAISQVIVEWLKLWYSCLSFPCAMAYVQLEVQILKGSDQGFFRVTFDKFYWDEKETCVTVICRKSSDMKVSS